MLPAALVTAAGLYAANRYFFSGGVCQVPGRLDGKLAVITGANTGIGKETVAELARRGCSVIMACRSIDRAENAKADILSAYSEGKPTALTRNIASYEIQQYLSPIKPDQIKIEQLDLNSLDSVREFATRICQPGVKIDFLINNAGIMACPYAETRDGFESQMGTNHLGHFLLTELLLPSIKATGTGARIINISSAAHAHAKTTLVPLSLDKTAYSRFDAYCRSKLANSVYANHLARRLASDGIITASVHPGAVQTDLIKLPQPFLTIIRVIIRPFVKSPWQGAQTTLYTILAKDIKSGEYYADCKVGKAVAAVFDESVAQELFEASAKAVGI